MNKADLTHAVSLKTGFTKAKSEQVINATLEAITQELANGGKVKLLGFGTFEVKERAARMGRNPKTKEQILIPPSRAPVFKPGGLLRELIL